VLERAGLIVRGGKHNGALPIEGRAVKHAARWIDDYKQHWEQNLDRSNSYLHQLHAKSPPKRHGRKKSDAQTPEGLPMFTDSLPASTFV